MNGYLIVVVLIVIGVIAVVVAGNALGDDS
jgi:hypothetical protein